MIPPALAEAICAALAHSLWLTSAAALLYLLARSSLRAAGRHRLGMLLLTTSAAAPIAAILHRALDRAPGTPPLDIAGNLSTGSATLPPATPAAPLDLWALAAPHAPTAIATLWLLGATLLLCRPLVGWWRLHRLRATCWSPLPDTFNQRARRLAARLSLPHVTFLSSMHDDVPFTYGWWRPVIVVPLAMITDLPLDLTDLLVEHELTHIARRDYLAQWAQRLAEAVLFFHPLAWWLSRQVTLERELACDARVVARHDDPLRYARALTELEALRPHHTPLALAATGPHPPGSLMHRIRTLVQPDTTPTLRGAAAAALLTLGVVGATTAVACSAADPAEATPTEATPTEATPTEATPADATPADATPADATEATTDVATLSIAWLPQNVTRHAALLTTIAEATGVSPDLLALMVLVESGGDPDAVSPYGARGLMQLMPATARAVAERHGIALPAGDDALLAAITEPTTNVTLGAHLVADLSRDHDELTWIWASYNAGSKAVRAHREDGTPLPDETERYVALLTALHADRAASTSPAYDAWRRRMHDSHPHLDVLDEGDPSAVSP